MLQITHFVTGSVTVPCRTDPGLCPSCHFIFHWESVKSSGQAIRTNLVNIVMSGDRCERTFCQCDDHVMLQHYHTTDYYYCISDTVSNPRSLVIQCGWLDQTRGQSYSSYWLASAEVLKSLSADQIRRDSKCLLITVLPTTMLPPNPRYPPQRGSSKVSSNESFCILN